MDERDLPEFGSCASSSCASYFTSVWLSFPIYKMGESIVPGSQGVLQGLNGLIQAEHLAQSLGYHKYSSRVQNY